VFALLFIAAASTAPINVTYCYTDSVIRMRDQRYYDSKKGWQTRRVPHIAGYDAIVSFVNTSPVPVTSVSFELSNPSNPATRLQFTDHGVFSPNVPIERHRFEGTLLSYGIDHPVCTVLGVKFADGSSWQPPAQQ
jgi:hypothetical protein